VQLHAHLPQADAWRLMWTCEVLVLPSTREVYGLVALEALAAGCKVVISDACGVARDIGMFAGVVTTGPDPNSLLHAIEAALRLPVPDNAEAVAAFSSPAAAHSISRAAKVAIENAR